jgi:hypothetical protein
MSVWGDWIETIDRATVSGSGVSVTIAAKYNGLQNQSEPFKGRGKVTLSFVTSNAAAGNRTVTLSGGVFGSASFTLTILASPSVTSVDVPAPPDPFKDIVVTLHGTGLQNATDRLARGVIINDNLVPLITVGGPASVSSVRVLSSSNTSLQAQIFFSALIQDATVKLSLRSDQECVPLHAITFNKTVRVKSTNVKNYVKSITFPSGDTFNKNDIATININLLFPAPGSASGGSLSTIPSGGLRPGSYAPELIQALALNRHDNSRVWIELSPSDLPAQNVPGTTNIKPTGKTELLANAGDNIIPIKFKVSTCLGGQPGQTNVVYIRTWMHNPNTTLPPDYVEQSFKVRCIQ